MFTVAARTLGYRVTVLDPDARCAGGRIRRPPTCRREFTDPAALDQLARTCAAVTTRIRERAGCGPGCPCRERGGAPRGVPRSRSPRTAGARRDSSQRTASRWAPSPRSTGPGTSRPRSAGCGCPALLKTARLGYDGKGQVRIERPEELARAFARMQARAVRARGTAARWIGRSRWSSRAARTAPARSSRWPRTCTRAAYSTSPSRRPASRRARGRGHRARHAARRRARVRRRARRRDVRGAAAGSC